jgi:lipid A ethanolaminephosphotransferase
MKISPLSALHTHHPFPKKWQCSTLSFVWLFTLGNTLLFQLPLLTYARNHLPLDTLNAALMLITLTVIQAGLMLAVLLLVSLVSLRLLKILCIFFLFGNVLALYFMSSYNVILDRAMMGNVFNTDSRETLELVNIKLTLYLIVAAFLPAIAILKLNLNISTWTRKISTLALVLLGSTAWLYANSSTWLWLDKHAKHVGAVMLPWSYVVNTVRHFDQVATKNQHQTLLPSAHFSSPIPSKNKKIVVLVIGESARAQNFSHYGYGRNTNPYTKSSLMAVMPNTRSCSTYTTQSVACMLSHQGSSVSYLTSYEPLPSYVQRHGVDVVWRSNNWGEPPLKVNTYERPANIQKSCLTKDCTQSGFDDILLYGLKERIVASNSTNVFIVLHLSGSHGPAYYTKYSPEFEKFKPVCRSVEVQKCTNEELVNAYDNTIVYTDHILYRLISMLEELSDIPSTMLYISDHGESLGEYGLFLHGAPKSIAPDVQINIPFFVWMSKSFQKNNGLSNQVLIQRPSHTHDHIFHSVMGAFGLRSDIYKAEFDIFSSSKVGL